MNNDNIRHFKVIDGKDIKWEFKKTEDGINHLIMYGAVRDKDTKSVIRRRNVDWYWRPTEDEKGNHKGV